MTTTVITVDTAFTPTGTEFRLHVSGGDRFDLYTRADDGSDWVHAGVLPNGTAHDVHNGVPDTKYKVAHSTRRAGLTPLVKLSQ